MASEPPRSRSWSPIDVGAAAAVLLALVGVVWSPKLGSGLARATGGMEPVDVTVDVRGVPSANPRGLLASATRSGKVAIVIRNQPHGTVKIRRIEPLERRLSILTPDGRIVSAPDPNQKVFGTFDARFVLQGEAKRSGDVVLLGSQPIKVGVPVELEGGSFRFNGTVTDLKTGAS